MAHISVWLNVILQAIINTGTTEKKPLSELARIKIHLLSLGEWNRFLDKNEKDVINFLVELIDKIGLSSSIEHISQVQQDYLVRIADVNTSYAQKATELQLNGMHHLVQAWRNIYQLNWDTTRVLIVCAHGPKRNLIEKQYFLDLYAEHGFPINKEINKYVLPVTMLDEQIATVTQKHLIDFLRKFQVNGSIAESMLGNFMAMTEDVLAPHAEPVLKKQKCPFYTYSAAIKKLSHFATKKDVAATEPPTINYTKK